MSNVHTIMYDCVLQVCVCWCVHTFKYDTCTFSCPHVVMVMGLFRCKQPHVDRRALGDLVWTNRENTLTRM